MKETVDNFLRAEGKVRKGHAGLIASLLALVAVVVGFVVYRLWRRRSVDAEGDRREFVPPPDGLTEAEAEARLDPENPRDNVISGRPRVTRKQIIRQTIFTIFNLNLILLGTIQFLFVRPLDGLITLGIIIVNVVANVLQFEIAQRRLKVIQEDARPQVTVMRDGKARSVDPREIVTGDVITAGRGDQIIADGQLVGEGSLLVDETILGNGGGSVRKQGGDQVLAGSICLNGRAAYRADVLGDDRQVIQYLHALPKQEVELTAIEKILNRVMRIMLVIMIGLVALILLRALQLDLLGSMAGLVDPIIVILNLAPASLFFMVMLTYVSATADLAKFGALVQQSRSVESLAQLDVLCFAKDGFLTGMGVDLQEIERDQEDEDDEENEEIALPRIRQILGDFAHSSTDSNPAMGALTSNYEGSPRDMKEIAPFLSAYGWSAVIFDDDDLQGLYVLAEADLFSQVATGLESEDAEPQEKEEGSTAHSLTSAIRHPLARFRKHDQDDGEPNQEVPASEVEGTQVSQGEGGEPEKKKGLFDRFASRMKGTVSSAGSMIGGDSDQTETAEEEAEPEEQNTAMIFAYNPDVRALDLSTTEWRLPDDLHLLCQINFEEKVKPEAGDAINLFSKRGVAVKIFAADEAEKTAVRLREAGVSLREDPQLTSIDAPQLEGLTTPELAEIALSHTVFGSLSPQQSAAIVKALRETGYSVGMAGDGVNDVAALRGAELAIVRKDSSPAVLGLGDIVLLEEGQTTLARVLEKGQRIVKGLVDILKLYMTQMGYLLLLILAIPLLLTGFPYTSQQAGLISLVTLTIPALGLTLWASTGRLPRAKLSSILLNFVLPAALSIAILGFLVYAIELQQGSSVEYTQNVLTYALVAMGLLLVVTIKPPVYIHFTRLPERGDIRPSIMVIISVIVFVIIARIPFFSEMFGITPLKNPTDLALVIGTSLIWVIVVNVFWWLFPVATKVGGTVSGELRDTSSDLAETIQLGTENGES